MGDTAVPANWLGKPEEYLDFTDRPNLRTDLLHKNDLIAKFGAANYAVFAVMLFISAAIGVFFWWRGQKNTVGSTPSLKSLKSEQILCKIIFRRRSF